MSGVPISLTRKKLLLVEGQDDEDLLGSLLTTISIIDVQIYAYEGKDNLALRLPAISRMPGFSELEALAITRDADENAASAFQSVRDILKANSVPHPSKPEDILNTGDLKVGIFILPGGNRSGELEDLFIEANDTDPRLAHVRAFDASCQGSGRSPFSSKETARELMLAHEIPKTRIGKALKAAHTIADLSKPAYGSLHTFFRSIFS